MVSQDAWIRKSQRTRRIAGIAAAMSAGFPLAIAVALIVGSTKPQNHSSPARIAAVGVVMLAIAAGGLLFARRLARTGLLMSAGGIVVRNPLSTKTIALADVDGFVAGIAQGGGNGTPCPILKKKNGGDVGVWALGREGFVWSFRRYEHELEPLCDELNAALEDLKAQRS